MAWVTVVSTASPSAAQQPNPEATAAIRWGSLALTPRIELTNLGIDTNVFNEPVDPKSDFTFVVSPQVQAWVRPRPLLLESATVVDFVYFQQYSNQRGVNLTTTGRMDIPLNRFKPWVADTFSNTQERTNAEIDTRARHSQNIFRGGLDVRVGPKTTLGAGYRRERLAYDEEEQFDGSNLRRALNRRAETIVAEMRHTLTPLTTLIASVEAQIDRFEFASFRDSDSLRIAPTFEFAPSALIRGSASVGFRRFEPANQLIEPYSGVVAAVDLTYTLRGTSRLQALVQRDVTYSYLVSTPYYLSTNFSGSFTQRITPVWEASAQAGTQRLDYAAIVLPDRQPEGADDARLDHVRTFGAGLGYVLGPSATIRVNADYYIRKSLREGHEYEGLRVGTSVAYGF
jgi:hypothetical protein